MKTSRIVEVLLWMAAAIVAAYAAHLWLNWTMATLHVAILAGLRIAWEYRKIFSKVLVNIVCLNENIDRLLPALDKVDLMWQRHLTLQPFDEKRLEKKIVARSQASGV